MSPLTNEINELIYGSIFFTICGIVLGFVIVLVL